MMVGGRLFVGFFFCLQFQFFFQFICGWLLMLRCGCSCSWDEHV